MKRFALVLPLLAALAAVGPVGAQTPKPQATPTLAGSYGRVPVTSLSNPNYRSNNSHAMSGQGCISGPTANRAQTAINPINGQAQAAPIVEIPLTKNGGSVANATTRTQQAKACAHPTH